MLKEFESYIEQQKLCDKTDRILLAVSGGADSVALLHLFHKANYSITIAHCNFNLRGAESDGDEEFVKQLAEKYKVESYFVSFQTKEFAKQNKLSIEMAARDLRYGWFSELCKTHSFSKIATGHHLNDSIETLFINLTRGTGINGITGIKPVNNELIRPLLFSTREKIENYLKSENLVYRTDSSNASNEFVRNIIRNQIIPAFKEINPSFEATMQQNIENFGQAAAIFNQEIAEVKKNILIEEGSQIKISIQKLLDYPQAQTLLFETLSIYGFSFDSVSKILECVKGESGRTFFSTSHQLLVDRDVIIIEQLSDNSSEISINNIDDFNNLPISLTAKQYNFDDFKLIKDNSIACLDADKIIYPIKLRKWKTGDYFYPLGMKSKKKISDFFIDQKIDRFTKEKTWLLESTNEIVWIVGLRIDDRYKVTEKTKNVILLKLN